MVMTKFFKKARVGLSLSLACLGIVASTHSSLAYSAETSFYSTRSHLPKLEFDLAAANNQRLTEKDLVGKVVLIYFGYTYCPDICPTTMAELALMKSTLSPQQQEQVQVLMISVDPHRDTPQRLEEYLTAFGMGAIGVTGTEREIADNAKRYRVSYQIEKPKNPDFPTMYDVMHAEGIYVFDQQGRSSFLASNSHDIEEMRNRVLKLLD